MIANTQVNVTKGTRSNLFGQSIPSGYPQLHTCRYSINCCFLLHPGCEV